MTRYSLRNNKTRELIKIKTVKRSDRTNHYLEEEGENDWMIDNLYIANYVLNKTPVKSFGFYIQTTYEDPSHKLNSKEWSVVEVKVETDYAQPYTAMTTKDILLLSWGKFGNNILEKNKKDYNNFVKRETEFGLESHLDALKIYDAIYKALNKPENQYVNCFIGVCSVKMMLSFLSDKKGIAVNAPTRYEALYKLAIKAKLKIR